MLCTHTQFKIGWNILKPENTRLSPELNAIHVPGQTAHQYCQTPNLVWAQFSISREWIRELQGYAQAYFMVSALKHFIF